MFYREGGERSADGSQAIVARRVAQSIVIVLEAIHIDHHHGYGKMGFLAAAKAGKHVNLRAVAVEQAGEAIRPAGLFQLLLRFAAAQAQIADQQQEKGSGKPGGHRAEVVKNGHLLRAEQRHQ